MERDYYYIIDGYSVDVRLIKTDENGNFRFLVSVGNLYIDKASKKGFTAKKVIDVDENWDDNTKLSLKLKEGVTSQGTVYNEDGTVATNTDIYLYNHNGYLLEKSQTDENIIEKVEQDIRKGIEMAFNWFKKK